MVSLHIGGAMGGGAEGAIAFTKNILWGRHCPNPKKMGWITMIHAMPNIYNRETTMNVPHAQHLLTKMGKNTTLLSIMLTHSKNKNPSSAYALYKYRISNHHDESVLSEQQMLAFAPIARKK